MRKKEYLDFLKEQGFLGRRNDYGIKLTKHRALRARQECRVSWQNFEFQINYFYDKDCFYFKINKELSE